MASSVGTIKSKTHLNSQRRGKLPCKSTPTGSIDIQPQDASVHNGRQVPGKWALSTSSYNTVKSRLDHSIGDGSRVQSAFVLITIAMLSLITAYIAQTTSWCVMHKHQGSQEQPELKAINWRTLPLTTPHYTTLTIRAESGYRSYQINSSYRFSHIFIHG